MPYQKPRPDHPWKTNKPYSSVELKTVKKVPQKKKPVRVFLTEIVESWENVEVVTTAYGREGRFNLNELSEEKVAAWITGILRRNYGQEKI